MHRLALASFVLLASCDAQVRIESEGEPESLGGQPPAVDPCNAFAALEACCQSGCTWLNPHGELFQGGCFSDAQDCSSELSVCQTSQVCLIMPHTGGERGQCPPKNYGLVETPWGVCLDECPADLPGLCYPGEGA